MTPAVPCSFNSWDAIKIIALLLVFIDHSGVFSFPDAQWLRALGRGAMPIFLFLIGYAASYRFKWSLLVLAMLMSASDFLLTHQLRTQNILFTILLCRLLFRWLERHGKRIERPWEWYAGCLCMFTSVFILQFGSLGLLFAICGYLKRHRQYYSPALPRRFLIATLVAYGCITELGAHWPLPDLLLMIAILCGIYRLLDRFDVRRVYTIPPALLRTGKWVSYYSGYIYAFHLIALEWMTGIPF